MRIALINSEYPSPTHSGHGGIATYTYLAANTLASLGHTVYILVREGTSPDSLSDSVNIYNYGFSPAPGLHRITDKFRSGKIVWERGNSRNIRNTLLSIHKRFGLDIAEFPDYNGLSYQCSGSLPFPVVVNFHTPSEIVDRLNNLTLTKERSRWHNFEREAIRRADGYRCPSIALRDLVTRDFSIRTDSIEIIRNPVSTDLFDRINKSHKNDRIDLLFAGRLEFRKGALILLRSLKKILQLNEHINVTFAGETELGDAYSYRQAIERTLSEAERKRVWFLGPLPSKKLAALYCRSSGFLFPSLFENSPYSLFEAISAQLPVIASSTGGVSEIIRHNETGLLFSPESIDELLGCIKKFIENRQFCEEMAQRAYQEIKTEFSPEKIAAESISFYQSLIDKFRDGRKKSR